MINSSTYETTIRFGELFDRFKEIYHDQGYRRDLMYGLVTNMTYPRLRIAVEEAGTELDKRRMRVLLALARRVGWAGHTPNKVGLHIDDRALDGYSIWPHWHEAVWPFRRFPAEYHKIPCGGGHMIVRSGRGNRAIRRAKAMAEGRGRIFDFTLVRAVWAYERRERAHAEFVKGKQEYEAEVAQLMKEIGEDTCSS